MSAAVLHRHAGAGYIGVRKAAKAWLIETVTPAGAMPALRSIVERCAGLETALTRGAGVTRVMQRPFKAPKEVRHVCTA